MYLSELGCIRLAKSVYPCAQAEAFAKSLKPVCLTCADSLAVPCIAFDSAVTVSHA
jgi:hypothetical protein